MPPVASKHKILAIDDSPTVRKLMEMILASEGYDIITAADGMEGLAKAKAESPSVVLVDFVMPKMNGYQVCKIMKETPELKDTPIILVTSRGEKVGSKFVEMLGVTEYFTKPFQPEDLLNKIQEVIDKHDAAKAASRAEAEAAAQAEPRAPAPPAEEVQPAAPSPVETPTPQAEAPPAAQRLSAEIYEAIQQAAQRFFQTAFPDTLREAVARLSPRESDMAVTPYLLSGDLQAFQLPDVLQLIGLHRHTGKLSIHRSGLCSEIYFQEGLVAFATMDRRPKEELLGHLLLENGKLTPEQLQKALHLAQQSGEPLGTVCLRKRFVKDEDLQAVLRHQTEQVIYQALSWRDGRFYFDREAPPYFVAERPLRIPVEDLILEGVRRIDEWRIIRKRIPRLDLVFVRCATPSAPARGLKPKEAKLLSLLDGKRDVRQLIKASRMSEWDVCRILYTLLSAKLIQPRPGGHPDTS